MANIKWSGIEQSKYGLTAKWYVSAYYGDDNDSDGVGLYNASNNTTGHGGPTRPFASLDKSIQQAHGIVVIDSGAYTTSINGGGVTFVGDGNVEITDSYASVRAYYNIKLTNGTYAGGNYGNVLRDCVCLYATVGGDRITHYLNNVFVESQVNAKVVSTVMVNNLLIKCAGYLYRLSLFTNNILLHCTSLLFVIETPRPVGYICDFSLIIGSIETSISINGKTKGVTIEDFRADGNYFLKSFSEVDIWGNEVGSGATVAQLQEVFCNYFSPIYIDIRNEANYHLKPSVTDIIKYGGLNGTYIGAKPIMHWFNSETLWDTYRDVANTTDLEKDAISKAIVISGIAESGTFRSTRISLPKPFTANIAKFAANLVYNIEGTVKQGVSNQRIDTTLDLLPDNVANQRVVYDFKLSSAPNNVDALSAFKNYELDREPTVDSQGRSHLDDAFDSGSEAKQTIQDFMIEFTLRKIVIE